MDEIRRNGPEDRLTDYPYKATIWRNESDKGTYFNVTISKTFRDGNGEYRETNSISSDDLLRVSELAREAHHKVNELKRALPREHESKERSAREEGAHERSDHRREKRRSR